MYFVIFAQWQEDRRMTLFFLSFFWLEIDMDTNTFMATVKQNICINCAVVDTK